MSLRPLPPVNAPSLAWPEPLDCSACDGRGWTVYEKYDHHPHYDREESCYRFQIECERCQCRGVEAIPLYELGLHV